jgi:hypothetical protein
VVVASAVAPVAGRLFHVISVSVQPVLVAE